MTAAPDPSTSEPQATGGSVPAVVAITGASGLIGSALSARLRSHGAEVVHLVRREPSDDLPERVREVRWNPREGALDADDLRDVDAVVNLAGAGIGDRRWTASYQEEIRHSRVAGTDTLVRVLAQLDPLPRLLSGSAIGFYGDRGDEVLTEASSSGDGFLADVCRQWEAATAPLEAAGASVAHLRTGIVLSRNGGAMARLLPLARFGLAGPLGRGTQYWSWITLHDVVGALDFLLSRPEVTGPVNICGPTPTPQREVVDHLGDHLHRPTVLPAPTPALRLALGKMASDILSSQRALPEALAVAGFRHEHDTLDAALSWLLKS